MKILLLGIGNVLFADEGIGVHFTNYIKKNYNFTHKEHTLNIMDGGTLAEALIPEIVKYNHLIIVDTVNASGVKPGEVYFFDFDKAPAEINWQGSAHEVEMLQTLMMMDMVGDRPKTQILGMTPTIIEPMLISLTQDALNAVPLMETTLIKYLTDEFGFKCTKHTDIPITELFEESILI